MAVERYRISLLGLEDCPLRLTPHQLLQLLKAWRKKHAFGNACSVCQKTIDFENMAYAVCCQQFYYNNHLPHYPLRPLAVETPGYVFLLPQLERMIRQADIQTEQEYLVLPDPIYWQVSTTLVYEKVAKFVLGLPMTRRTKTVQPPSKAPVFYKQIQEAPLNYGSLESRSCGKATLIRQVAFGKRCRYSMRGMIVPDASLQPNQIRIPDYIVDKFGLRGKWVVLNRMPSLQPENFVALRVEAPGWPHECFGIPLEILTSINGDFDGDEANIYLVPSVLAQAECAALLNPEAEMGSFVMGLKLAPSQDMLVAYYLFYDEIDFLPYKQPDLKKTLRVIYDLYGSERTFRAFNDLRLFYLHKLQNDCCYALTLQEMDALTTAIENGVDLKTIPCCLTVQALSGAKGDEESLMQLFGRIGTQSGVYIKSSFRTGLYGENATAHGRTSMYALFQMLGIWLPGYIYNKIMSNVHDMKVDYKMRIVDADMRVVLKDSLDGYHYTDVLSADTFAYLTEQVLLQRNFEFCSIGSWGAKK